MTKPKRVPSWRRLLPHRHTRHRDGCTFCGARWVITGYDDDYGYSCWGWRRPPLTADGRWRW